MRFVQNIALSVALFVMGLELGGVAEPGLLISVDDPGIQGSTVPGVTTESFDEFGPGNYSSLNTAVGTLTSAGGQFSISPADVYGGAGLTGSYFAVGTQSGSAAPVTLQLSNGPQAYFGFWWSAGDTANQVSFYSGNQLLGTFDAANLLSKLGSA